MIEVDFKIENDDDMSFSAEMGGGGVSEHDKLKNRDLPNQHPISAITGLETALNGKQTVIPDLEEIRQGAEKGKTAVQPSALDGYATKQELNGKQDTITDLDEIREGVSKGKTAVQPADIPVKDVQANGVSVLEDGVANIPMATSNTLGLVRPVLANGIYVSTTGTLNLSKLSDTGLANKASNYAVLVNQIDLATKVGVTTNTIELTDEEKVNACNWVGAGQKRTIVIDSTTPTVTIDNALSNTDYQYGTITSLTITAVENSYLETNFFFTAGSEITVDLPDTLKIIGSPSFEANEQYAMSICNNTLIVGIIS